MTTTDSLTKEEFCARFKARMIEYAGGDLPDDDGRPLSEYADEVASTYWEDPDQRAWGPEECADADISYWGEE